MIPSFVMNTFKAVTKLSTIYGIKKVMMVMECLGSCYFNCGILKCGSDPITFRKGFFTSKQVYSGL